MSEKDKLFADLKERVQIAFKEGMDWYEISGTLFLLLHSVGRKTFDLAEKLKEESEEDDGDDEETPSLEHLPDLEIIDSRRFVT